MTWTLLWEAGSLSFDLVYLTLVLGYMHSLCFDFAFYYYWMSFQRTGLCSDSDTGNLLLALLSRFYNP